ncbi:hypothetical protein H8959_022768 [Pygathrix nigripes]
MKAKHPPLFPHKFIRHLLGITCGDKLDNVTIRKAATALPWSSQSSRGGKQISPPAEVPDPARSVSSSGEGFGICAPPQPPVLNHQSSDACSNGGTRNGKEMSSWCCHDDNFSKKDG